MSRRVDQSKDVLWQLFRQASSMARQETKAGASHTSQTGIAPQGGIVEGNSSINGSEGTAGSMKPGDFKTKKNLSLKNAHTLCALKRLSERETQRTLNSPNRVIAGVFVRSDDPFLKSLDSDLPNSPKVPPRKNTKSPKFKTSLFDYSLENTIEALERRHAGHTEMDKRTELVDKLASDSGTAPGPHCAVAPLVNTNSSPRGPSGVSPIKAKAKVEGKAEVKLRLVRQAEVLRAKAAGVPRSVTLLFSFRLLFFVHIIIVFCAYM